MHKIMKISHLSYYILIDNHIHKTQDLTQQENKIETKTEHTYKALSYKLKFNHHFSLLNDLKEIN